MAARSDEVLLHLFRQNRQDRLQNITWLSVTQKALARYYASLQSAQMEPYRKALELGATIQDCNAQIDLLLQNVNDENAQDTLRRCKRLRGVVRRSKKQLDKIVHG